MPDDPNVSTGLTNWVQLELGDVARRLQKIYAFLSQLDTTYENLTRVKLNAPALLKVLREMIDQVQRQDSLDIGDPDINEEVIATLQNLAINVESAVNTMKFVDQSLTKTAGELSEAQEAISDLARYVANY